jgi:Ser/Thr protein kinase RdoA (MazF antagonist)
MGISATEGFDAGTPFAGLTPDTVLDALDAVGMSGDGRLIQLNSYENRVFQAFLDDGPAVVLKFYRPARWSNEQILEEHDFGTELALQEIPVVAPLALSPPAHVLEHVNVVGANASLAVMPAAHGGYRYSVSPRRAGRAPELEDPQNLRWIGRFIGRMHAIGRVRRFAHRITFDAESIGTGSRDWLLAHDTIPPDAKHMWQAACDAAMNEVRRAFGAAGDLRHLRLHGDCHPGNLLWTDAGPHFVDLDDACNGPAMQDLWMLLSGSSDNMASQLAELLAGYEAFMDFDGREIQLVEALRTLRMIYHSAWIARRWSDPAFPVAFPWFDGAAYWQQQAQQLREQVDTMRETSDRGLAAGWPVRPPRKR